MEDASESDALDFDEEFIQIDAAICEYDSVGDSPQRKGESAFQWGSIENACSNLLKKAKDIRVAIWYLRACMTRRGVVGLAEGVGCLAAIMSLPANEIHPRSQPGESPGEIQVLHLGWISGAQFLHQVGTACLEGQDVTISALASKSGGEVIWAPGRREKAQSILVEIKDSFIKIAAALQIGEQHLDLSRILSLLDRALSVLGTHVGEESNSLTDAPSHNVSASVFHGNFDTRSALSTRADVEVALERIVEYFRVHEPGHPAPIFLSRVQRMLGAGFEELMVELYPNGAALAAQLGRPAGSAE
ncbi:ImpA [Burkholderia pyrrocinia]|uniref:type VI secretion system protein TssA n=1 Tax=Burkholderia stagnalis TaxID=1503054 RepID=UPI000756DD01|nr:ImpA [Burkholderia pyrrocinia]